MGTPWAQTGPVKREISKRPTAVRSGMTVEWAERFWAKVDKTGVCWLWTAAVDRKGYGKFGVRTDAQQILGAHRCAFFLTHDKWPDPCCLHRCDVRACVNPDHLFEGTDQENSDDKIAKGRQVILKGSEVGDSKLTEDQVLEIRRLCVAGINRKDIADAFGVCERMVRKIYRREKWAHVP